MPYRIVLQQVDERALDQLVQLGALDVELIPQGGLVALMPDGVAPEQVASTLGLDDVTTAPAAGRDEGSVWMLSLRPLQIGRLRIVPADVEAAAGSLRMIDGPAFGSGFHPTTALCLEMLDEIVTDQSPRSLLDVGAGSGILALAALTFGVPRAVGIDIDADALSYAARNRDLNGLRDRLHLVRGGPDVLAGTWPLVAANILAAPLMEMAPTLVRRVGHHGELILSGVPASLERQVGDIYRRLGMQRVRAAVRGGWVALLLRASW